MSDPEDMRIPLDVVDQLLSREPSLVDATFLKELRCRPYTAADGCVPGTMKETARFLQLRNALLQLNGHMVTAKILAPARDFEPADDEVETEPVLIDTGAPYDVARLFVENDFTVKSVRTLHHHRGVFYRWSGTTYSGLGDDAMRSRLYEFLNGCEKSDPKTGERKPVKPNKALVGNVADALRAAAYLEDTVSAPAWLEQVTDIDADELVACANGLLRLPTLDLLPHTPTFYNHNALDFAFEPKAPQPRHWLEFLNQLWPNDQQSIDTLQEIFGLCLTGDTAQQKAFLIVGPKRSGKGTIARVLTQLIGGDNVVAPTLAGIGTNFGLAPLIGKRVAIISDARLGGKADQQVIAERLLSITGEDGITIDRKFISAWTAGYKSASSSYRTSCRASPTPAARSPAALSCCN